MVPPVLKPHARGCPKLFTSRCFEARPVRAPGRVRAQTGHLACGDTSSSRRQLAVLLATVVTATTLPTWASKPKKVFVAGATGLTGKQVVAVLRAQGIEVVAGVRNEKKAKAQGLDSDSGITVKLANVTSPPEELAKAMAGCEAVICAIGGGAITPFDKRAKEVDNKGTRNLVDAAKLAKVKSFVYVSSLLTNAKAVGQEKNPNYTVLQLFGGVLEEKLQAEKYIRASGLRWTIVRPGGLSGDPASAVGNLIVGREDSLFGLDGEPGREISRETVAEVCVEALNQDSGADKVVEIVASRDAPKIPLDQWFNV